MKISMIKLRGRAYLMGNLLLLSLLFFTVLSFSICLNILPETALQLLSSVSENTANIITAIISIVVMILVFCVFSAADMGLRRFFLRKAQRKGGSVKDLFFYFNPRETVRLICFSVKMTFMKAALLTLYFLPFLLSLFLLLSLIRNSASLNVSVVMLLSTLCLFLNGIMFYSKMVSSLFLVKYYFVNGEYLDFRHLISSSQNQMKKHKKTLMKLKISFTGWFLSCIFLLPVGYVFSYFCQSKAVAAAEFMSH